MKAFAIFFTTTVALFFLPVMNCMGQNGQSPVTDSIIKNPGNNRVYEMFDIAYPPSFNGGFGSCRNWFSSQHAIAMPYRFEKPMPDCVTVSFVVDRTGRIGTIQVLADSSYGKYAEHAVTLIGQMPPWRPGEANGNPVNIRDQLLLCFDFLPAEACTDTLLESLIPECRAPRFEIGWFGARFPGDSDSLYQFLRTNLKYEFKPLYSLCSKPVFPVFVDFNIEENGRLSCVTATMSKATQEAGYGREALRVMSLMPNWIPPPDWKNPGRKLRGRYTLVLSF